MTEFLTMVLTKNLNLFPNDEGISEYYSPQMILKSKSVDYKRHCEFEFGDYVQVYDDQDIKNNNIPRTIDAIYLRPSPDMPNEHDIMDLFTGRKISRPQLTK